MMSVTLLVAFILVGESFAEVNFKACRKYNTYGYAYLEYFLINTVAEDPGANGNIHFEVYVRATRDAHVLLSADQDESLGYEIVLGGGNNTFSQIRLIRGRDKKAMKTVKTTSIVSSSEVRGFWIDVLDKETITVGKVGDPAPVLVWRNTKPFPVYYVSFSTWTNVMGEWFYACRSKIAPGAADDRNMTTEQRLRHQLFSNYTPTNYPEADDEQGQTVEIHLDASHFHLDEKRGELLLAGMMDLRWKDWRLTWNPAGYDNISFVYVTPQQVWTPDVHVVDSALHSKPLLSRKGRVAVTRDGDIFWRAPFRAVTVCSSGYANWPNDQHNCSLKFGLLSSPLTIDLKHMSWWKLPMSQWYIRNGAADGGGGVVRLQFQRRDPSLIGVLILPSFLCAGVLSLLSFWLHPSTLTKLFLSCGSVSILVITLIGLGDVLPTHATPALEIVRLYMCAITLTCFPVLLFIGLNYVPSGIRLPRFVVRLLNSVAAEIAFCLPDKREIQAQGRNMSDRESGYRVNAARLFVLFERFVFLCYFAALVVPFWMIVSLLQGV